MNILPNENLMLKDFSAQTILNWVLPAVGTLIAIALIIYLWRYLRKSNEVGRITEFDEKGFKKLIEEHGSEEYAPFCQNCKLPMRFEIRYKDFMKDQGDFLINKETAEQTLKTLVECERISQEHMDFIMAYFEANPELEQQLFKRYKCPNCSRIKVIPYKKT
ncbi:MAG: hypothetical protein ACFFDW_07055 [Candidatus Thorarchaeota archaeon]